VRFASFIDDADDGGVDRAILHSRRHTRRAAADDEHRLAHSGVDRVDRDEMIPVGLAAGIDGPNHHQLVADEPRILPRRDDGSHNLG